ncbi:uncharacterized protein LOC142640300 [Castanea sativa]|uniref:uncharacterized protein LOC142640300 n=1 Tax=Castanea sativa TaxID=21020 RepID=UPI003F6542C9
MEDDVQWELARVDQRASKDILPTKDNLCRRLVLDSSICEACGDAIETSGHVFWVCVVAHEVWDLSGICFDTVGDRVHEFQQFQDSLWHLKFGQQVDKELLGLVCIVAWCLWSTRNEVRLGKVRPQASTIFQKARYLLNEFQTTNLKLAKLVHDENVQWQPLMDLWFKVNVDGATFAQSQTMEIGVLVCDFVGKVEAKLSKCLPLPLGPLENEAKAMEEGI